MGDKLNVDVDGVEVEIDIDAVVPIDADESWPKAKLRVAKEVLAKQEAAKASEPADNG